MVIMLETVGKVIDATDAMALDILPGIAAMRLAVSVCRTPKFFVPFIRLLNGVRISLTRD